MNLGSPHIADSQHMSRPGKHTRWAPIHGTWALLLSQLADVAVLHWLSVHQLVLHTAAAY